MDREKAMETLSMSVRSQAIYFGTEDCDRTVAGSLYQICGTEFLFRVAVT